MFSSLRSLLVQSQLNWFEFCEISQNILEGNNEHKFFQKILHFGFEQHELELIQQSHDAYLASGTEDHAQQRIQNAINGDIVTDSESDHPEDYIELECSSEHGR